jgi:tetraacyldisaccharide 4'-kinase
MWKRSHPVIFTMLLPFSLLYGLIVYLRNLFFDWGWLTSQQFSVPLICIGNLTAGGTGKTPHAEYLIRLLKEEFKLAYLSRGYNRKAKGFRIVEDGTSADEIGDEPLQIKTKFTDILVAVCERRVKGVKEILKIQPETDVILLDDAFQHRYVKADMSILLMDYNHPWDKEFLLPAGNLREQVSGKDRANIFVVSKSPENLKPIDKRLVMKSIVPRPYQTCFFSRIKYGNLKGVFLNGASFATLEYLKENEFKILMVTGIANPDLLREYLEKTGLDVITMTYRDHYSFNDDDLVDIFKKLESIDYQNKIIITTEKDAMRFKKFANIAGELIKVLYYIPVEVEFLNSDAKNFNHQIVNYVRSGKRNHLFYSKQNQIST